MTSCDDGYFIPSPQRVAEQEFEAYTFLASTRHSVTTTVHCFPRDSRRQSWYVLP